MFVPIPEIGPPSEDDPTSNQDASLLKTISTALPGSKRLDSIRSWAYQKTGLSVLSQSLYDPSLHEEYVVKPTKDVHEYFSRVMNWPVPADLFASPVSETGGSSPALDSIPPTKQSLLHRIVTNIPFFSTETRILSSEAEPSKFNGLAFDDEEESFSSYKFIPAHLDSLVDKKYHKTEKELEDFREDLKEDIVATTKAVKCNCFTILLKARQILTSIYSGIHKIL